MFCGSERDWELVELNSKPPETDQAAHQQGLGSLSQTCRWLNSVEQCADGAVDGLKSCCVMRAAGLDRIKDRRFRERSNFGLQPIHIARGDYLN